jgi:hypothetical protein
MKNSTTIKVPKKYHKMIQQIYHDSDGYWVYTEKGYYATGIDKECHTIHEDTHQEILRQIRMIKPCDCNYCKGLED